MTMKVFNPNNTSPVALAAMLMTTSISAEIVRFTGEAYDLKSGKFIYTENHEEHYKNGKHAFSIVRYKDPGGNTLAEKKIYFDRHLQKPHYILKDLRDGYVEGLKYTGGAVKLLSRRKASEEIKEKTVTIPGPAVFDGGFDYFVRENFDKLLQKKPLAFNFAVPIELDYFKFRVVYQKEEVIRNRKAITFRMEPDNFVVRQLVSPIYISYDLEKRRLLRYKGISNVNDPSGKSYKAMIEFK